MKRCLITGGTGFIGSNLARKLVADGHDVHLLLRQSVPTWRTRDIFNQVTVHVLDLRDRDRVAELVRECRPEWIFHLAAHGAYSWQKDGRTIFETNVMGTVNLVDACRTEGFESLVCAGSSSEYGAKNHAPREDSWLEPNSCYAVAKAASTLYCQHVGRELHRRISVLRLYSVYGPFEEPGRLMPTLILKGLDKTLPPLVDPGTQRDFVHVDDAVRAFIMAAECEHIKGGEVFNVGAGRQTTIRDIVHIARIELGIDEQPEWGSMAPREWDVATWVCNNNHICNVLGWRPRISLEEGFKAMVEWFRLHEIYAKEYVIRQ